MLKYWQLSNSDYEPSISFFRADKRSSYSPFQFLWFREADKLQVGPSDQTTKNFCIRYRLHRWIRFSAAAYVKIRAKRMPLLRETGPKASACVYGILWAVCILIFGDFLLLLLDGGKQSTAGFTTTCPAAGNLQCRSWRVFPNLTLVFMVTAKRAAIRCARTQNIALYAINSALELWEKHSMWRWKKLPLPSTTGRKLSFDNDTRRI